MRQLMGVETVMVLALALSGCGKSSVPAVGQVAPEIEGEDIDGKPLKLSDYRGKVVVLNFWGTW